MLERVRAEYGEPCDPSRETGCTAEGVAAHDADDCMLWKPEQPVEDCMAMAALIRNGGPPAPADAPVAPMARETPLATETVPAAAVAPDAPGETPVEEASPTGLETPAADVPAARRSRKEDLAG